MRVLAYYMAKLGDYSMVEVLADPDTDLHAESAKGIFQLDREPLDPERQLGKNMNFSMVYGGGKPAVLRYLNAFNLEVLETGEGTPIPANYKYAGIVLNRFHERWPGISTVVRALEEAWGEKGYLRTINGAHLHPPKPHAQLNAVVQSSAAEVMRRALRVCHKNLEGMNSHLVCAIHDELVFDIARGELSGLVENIPLWMDYEEISEILPVTVSFEISEGSWADKVKL